MTVSLCIRKGSKRNDDSVSVEELDWSAERQDLIPAEHLWCDFKCRPWVKNSSPNTNDLYIWVQSFHTLQNGCNGGGNKKCKYMNYVSISFFCHSLEVPFSLLKKLVSQSMFPLISFLAEQNFSLLGEHFSPLSKNSLYTRPVQRAHTKKVCSF